MSIPLCMLTHSLTLTSSILSMPALAIIHRCMICVHMDIIEAVNMGVHANGGMEAKKG